MSWSGTSSAHIWNIFLDTADNEKTIASAPASSISLAVGPNVPASGWSSGSQGGGGGGISAY
jgi:hypothetical protein